MSDKTGTGDGNGDGSRNDGAKLTVGEKEYTAKDVENLLARETSLTQESQKVAALRNAAEKYGVSVEDYVTNADGALGIAAQLIEDGVIDNRGKLIKKEEKPDKDHVDPLTIGHQQAQSKEDGRLAGLIKAVEEQNKTIEELRKDNTNVLKLGLKRDIMIQHPELTENETLAVLDRLHENPRKSVWDHAKEAVENKKTLERATEESYAKKFGIDIEQWRKRNDKTTQGNEGASAIVGEKKLVFGHRKNKYDKDKTASPKEALMNLMRERGIHS